MTIVRRRRRPHPIRLFALAAPVVALSLVGAALVLEGRWPVVAAASAALLAVLPSALVLRLDRERRREIAAVRARVAADWSAEHARHSAEHRSVIRYLVTLLDAASSRIGLLRHRVDWLEGELAVLRLTRPGQPVEAGAELAQLTEDDERAELWPDHEDAPTVVDLAAWDERVRGGSQRAAPTREPERRTA